MPQVALLAYDLGQQSVYSSNACAEQDAHNKLGRGIGRTKVVKWIPMLLFSTPSIRPKQVIAQPEAPRMYHIGGLALLFPGYHGALPARNNLPVPANRDPAPLHRVRQRTVPIISRAPELSPSCQCDVLFGMQ